MTPILHFDLSHASEADIGYDTPESAITGGKTLNRESGIEALSAKIQGQRITHISYSEASIRFQLSSGRTLAVDAGNAGLSIKLMDDQQPALSNPITENDNDSVKARFDDSPLFAWHRKRLLTERTGSTITQLFYNQHLYIYTKANLILDIVQVHRMSDKQPVLYWDETD